MMQFSFLLEDSTQDNGCTVVVPGSHQSGDYTNRDLKKVYPIEGKPGDVIIWDSRLWHGTLKNQSNESRWALIATLSMWWVKQSMDFTRSTNQAIYDKCSNEQKLLLGFCSIPPSNFYLKTNTKTGYDHLLSKVDEYYKTDHGN
jgi:ectoine hydroxylase-related dioxygenase (phytanoyl-CoA dioxygenase family)